MPKILGLTTSAFDPASRVRFIQFIPHLKRAGWEVAHRPNVPDRQWSSSLPGRIPRALHHRAGRLLMRYNRWRDIVRSDSADVIFVNRDLAGDGLFFEKRLLKRNTRVVFDFDDAIYLGPNEPAVRWMCKNAAWVTPGNEYLGKYARQHTDRVTVIPTVIDTDLFLPQITRPHEEKLVRVGWSGSDQSIQATLFPFLPILMEVQRSTPFELVIVTNTRPQLPVGTDFLWRFVPWSPQLEPHFGTYMDIGIMPLLDQPFQRGKCGFKLLQYMAAALPTIASPVGVNRQITENGCTGFFAETERDWREALDRLLTSFELRRDMGRSGRRRCVQLYSLATWLPRLTAIFEAVANGSGLKSADRLLTSTY